MKPLARPTPAKLLHWLFEASLAIKGVLQLRGWWSLDGAIVEQELDVEA